MTFFTDNGIVCHIFHITSVLFEFTLHFYLIFTSLFFFYLTLHMITDQSMEAEENTLFFYAKYKNKPPFFCFVFLDKCHFLLTIE